MLLQLNKGWTNPPKVWDLRSNKFDKKGFTTMMEERSDKVIHNRFVTPQDLDAYGLSFVMDMTECLDETAPLTSKPTNIARPGWFDSECKRLLRRLRHIRRYLRNRTRLQRRRGLPDYQNRQKYTWNDYLSVLIYSVMNFSRYVWEFNHHVSYSVNNIGVSFDFRHPVLY